MLLAVPGSLTGSGFKQLRSPNIPLPSMTWPHTTTIHSAQINTTYLFTDVFVHRSPSQSKPQLKGHGTQLQLSTWRYEKHFKTWLDQEHVFWTMCTRIVNKQQVLNDKEASVQKPGAKLHWTNHLSIIYTRSLIVAQALFILGMCNSDQALDYSAVTAMIDHENGDRGGKKFWLVIAALWVAPWALIILHTSVQSIDVRRERSLALKSRSDVWDSYINIGFI